MFRGEDYDELSDLICDPIQFVFNFKSPSPNLIFDHLLVTDNYLFLYHECSELLAEGPMMEGNDNKKLRYIILFSDLIICATKVDPNTLNFEWKSDLVNTKIEFQDGT
jgi:hypothetical protein